MVEAKDGPELGTGSGRQLALGYGTTIQNVEPGAGADVEANDTQGQLALGVWYTTEQDDERAGKWWRRGRLVAEWVLECRAWDDTQGHRSLTTRPLVVLLHALSQ